MHTAPWTNENTILRADVGIGPYDYCHRYITARKVDFRAVCYGMLEKKKYQPPKMTHR